MRSAIEPEQKGRRVQTYVAKSGRKRVDGYSATADGNKVTLKDSRGTVLVRDDMGSHDNAKRVAREWVA